MEFNHAISYIREKSPQNADKVKKILLEKIVALVNRPEIHPPDKFKFHNTGNYRAFELFHYRVSYLVKDQEIIITRVRHTSQKPKMY